MVGAGYFNITSDVNLNRHEMAWRWLGGCTRLFPTIAGVILDRCTMAEGMTWWLVPTSSNDFGCRFRSPKDGWEMAGWLVLTISKDFGFHFGSLGDAWEMAVRMCIKTPNTTHTISTTTNHTAQMKTEPDGWVLGCGYFKHIWCRFISPGDGWEMVGWLPQAISKGCG